MATLLKFYRDKSNVASIPPPHSLKDQHVLITGGNIGLGLACAIHCVNLGASSVIITCRDAIKGAEAKSTIEAATNTTDVGIVKVMHLDMTFSGVQKFAEEVKREERIDFVLLNAGVYNHSQVLSDDGWENTLHVNVLSTVLLALLLSPWMKVAGKGNARLAFVGSGRHRGVDISGWPKQNVLDYWNAAANFKKVGAVGMYSISKLFVVYAMREIAQISLGKDNKPEVIVSSMCPGAVATNLARDIFNIPLLGHVSKRVLTAVMQTPEGGARTLVHAALLRPEDNGKHFTFYQSDEEYEKEAEKNVFGPEGQEMQKQVWAEILDLLEKQVPELREIACPGSA